MSPKQRRALPPGVEVPRDCRFVGEAGPVSFAGLFGDKDTLVVYNYMFGPERERPCPMCTSLLSAWDGEVPDILRQVALAVVARSPIERLVAFKQARLAPSAALLRCGRRVRPRLSCLARAGAENTAFNVFTRTDGTIGHIWGGEMGGASADPGQDPRGAPDLMPIWTILDSTPGGRKPDWYPKLDYWSRTTFP